MYDLMFGMKVWSTKTTTGYDCSRNNKVSVFCHKLSLNICGYYQLIF